MIQTASGGRDHEWFILVVRDAVGGVDGTMIQAWVSMKSGVKPIVPGRGPGGPLKWSDDSSCFTRGCAIGVARKRAATICGRSVLRDRDSADALELVPSAASIANSYANRLLPSSRAKSDNGLRRRQRLLTWSEIC